MVKVPLGRQKQIGFTLFRWGLYFQFRWRLKWHHVKVGWWTQRGLRVSTRYQRKVGRKPRYVTALRFNVSYWSSSKGKNGTPYNFGLMFFAGRSQP